VEVVLLEAAAEADHSLIVIAKAEAAKAAYASIAKFALLKFE